jgi:hypothetical protein
VLGWPGDEVSPDAEYGPRRLVPASPNKGSANECSPAFPYCQLDLAANSVEMMGEHTKKVVPSHSAWQGRKGVRSEVLERESFADGKAETEVT